LNTPIALRWKAYAYQTTHTLKQFTRKFLTTIGFLEYDISTILFFAEDEVVKAWEDAQYIVDNDLHDIVQVEARRHMFEGQCVAHAVAEARRRLQSGIDDNTVASQVEKHGTTTTTATSLQLPINPQEHLSEKFTSDALLLQEQEIIWKVTNESATALDEAAKSMKAISDTGDVVSALLTDPSSQEALKCCASILSVYHELCSTDVEEQVSDARLFFFVFVLALCGMVKSLIRHFKVLWLPEAAGCILVGGAYEHLK
jgi:hypothetical protein